MAQAWSLELHAIGMVSGCGVALVVHSPWPLALAAFLSFSMMVASAFGRWTPSGALGPASQLTAVRLLVALGLLVAPGSAPRGLLVAAALAVFALDGLDGRIARRRGCASDFGARFDTETDAAFVLILGLALWQRNGVGLWALLPGVLRYAYVLCLVLLPPSGGQSPRSRFGRNAFGLSTSFLIAALAMPGTAGTVSAAIGTLVTCASFAWSFYGAYPGLPGLLRSSPTFALRAWRASGPTLLFLVAWTFLNVVVNVRYPATEPAGWYFLPSLDVAVLLGGFALLGLAGWQLAWFLRAPIVVLFVLARLLRMGDGITGQFFGQAFNIYTDVPLVPELVRYAHSTFAAWKFYAGAAGALIIVALLILAIDRALAWSAAYFQRRRRILVFAVLVLPFVVLSLFIDHDRRYNHRYAGAFADSVAPRLRSEATFLLNVYDHRASEARAIASAQERLRRAPADLARLHHANVYLIFVESYGSTLMNRPCYAEKALPALNAMDSDLAQHGFATASGLLDSATYGGMSWLAHATLMTGVPTSNQLQYDLLGVSQPRSMARIMRDAGYSTTLVEPNTNRKSRVADFYDFDIKYNTWNFDYAGPPFAWATMPDQYVMDFVRRRVVAENQGPRFVAYVLVSSHAPWSIVPTYVPDWSQVGNGAIYADLPTHRANTNWPNFSNASQPYLTSILYDLDVLRSYLTNFVKDDELVIILGDHQPVSELTENSSSWAVPIHVVSRDSSFIAPFLARGYARGMVPGRNSAPMEGFLVDFLHDFSGGAS